MREIEINLISKKACANLISTDTGVHLAFTWLFQLVVVVFLYVLLIYLDGNLDIDKNGILNYAVISIVLVVFSMCFISRIFYKLYEIHYKRAIQIEYGYESDSSISINSNP